MHVQTIASVGYQRKFHNATGIRHLETLLHWTLSCLLASLFRCLVLTAPPFFHANFSSAACLSALQPPTSSLSCPTTNCLCSCPTTNSSPGSRRQLSFASPYHFRIRRDFFVQESFVWFRAKTDSSALAAYPHSATDIILLTINHLFAQSQMVLSIVM